ncbi:hypothetical protein GXW82_28740 [Streptacidiphilus sp. 4-A2]|nr:hypothetical protein [Streptacidiphilus sp. 4-A2]
MNFEVNRGRAGELLALLDAGGRGPLLGQLSLPARVHHLAALLPGWATAGGPQETLRRLGDPAARAAIREAMEVHGSDGCHGVSPTGRRCRSRGVRSAGLRSAVGLTVAQLAERERESGFDAFSSAAAPGLAGQHHPAACGRRAERPGDHAAPGAPGAATGCSGDRAARAATGPSRATSATMSASRGCWGLAECVSI